MKKIITLLFCLFLVYNGYAQNNPAEQVATTIAQKMKDSLLLSDAQRGQIYGINIRLHEQKMQARQQHANDRALIGKGLQQVENTRDSLYQGVLTAEQCLLYQQKKRSLISNN